MQQGMMKLYKDNKVNPASGCLPILIQIPIFFSLYKVIFVTIELRHAPWVGWFRDLSAPDPSSIFNLFGLFPWDAPAAGSITALIFIGVLPILLGVSMWLQQKLNPTPSDPTQKMIFAWMPWVFMFMLTSSHLPSSTSLCAAWGQSQMYLATSKKASSAARSLQTQLTHRKQRARSDQSRLTVALPYQEPRTRGA